jgi:hypothetical protein
MILSGFLSFLVFLLSFCLLSSGEDTLGFDGHIPTQHPIVSVTLFLLLVFLFLISSHEYAQTTNTQTLFSRRKGAQMQLL